MLAVSDPRSRSISGVDHCIRGGSPAFTRNELNVKMGKDKDELVEKLIGCNESKEDKRFSSLKEGKEKRLWNKVRYQLAIEAGVTQHFHNSQQDTQCLDVRILLLHLLLYNRSAINQFWTLLLSCFIE